MKSHDSSPAGEPADFIIRGALVLTMNPEQPRASAVAVRGNTIVFVGNDQHAEQFLGPATTVVDAKGRFICPGFHDSHNHMLMTGLGMLIPTLSGARSVGELLTVLRTQADDTPAGTWVVSAGDWHESRLHEARMASRAELDEACPAHPAVLRRGGHNIVLNSMALERLEIAEDSQAPASATYVRDNGRLTGQIIGNAHVTDLLDLLPKPGPNQYREALETVQRRYSAAGITSVIDPALTLEEMQLYRSLAASSGLQVRVSMLWRVPPPRVGVDAAVRMIESGQVQVDDGDGWARTIGVKICVDGGVETGYYREQYRRVDDIDHPRGKPFLGTEDLDRLCKAANLAGLPVGAHCVGDAGIDMVLDAYEKANVLKPLEGQRWTLIHMLYPHSEHWDRVNALGVGIAAQEPLHFALGSGFAEYLGSDRAAAIAPLADYLAKCENPIGGGSDSPVAPYEPLLGIEASVTRSTRSAGVLGHEFAISPRDALAMYTSGSAWCANAERRLGTLAPGMLADLVVLSDDPGAVASHDIGAIEVLLTVVDGRVSHGEFDGGVLPRIQALPCLEPAHPGEITERK
ncbi:amidohydrolase [Pseudarthrobacter sp. SSS035]|uniref:amidohydrolase n=1 Tax=Pseudarthrobacter sp. SSS035 TaxID=2931399 RepID=UPI00200CE9DD|nr:amidohydrolase [Pseudarthrobacter sp. SSS035]